MKVIYSDEQKRHHPRFFLTNGKMTTNPEMPERADILFEAAISSGLTYEVPGDFGLESVAAIHSPEYVEFLKTIHARWQELDNPSEEVLPKIHPVDRSGLYPDSPIGQAGFHIADTSCPISAETWGSALRSAHSATQAAGEVLSGASSCYGLARPPGHHAFRDIAGGFCYFNNSAIAAATLREKHSRVAIIDVDLHHGNGTQGIFYERSDVLTVSIHADPRNFYPFFWGGADERGAAAGEGGNLNLPLELKTGDNGYLKAMDQAIERIECFAPGAIVIALGLDASEKDPFGGLCVTTDGFAKIAAMIAGLGKPTVLIQEGGYISDELGRNLSSFLESFQAHH